MKEPGRVARDLGVDLKIETGINVEYSSYGARRWISKVHLDVDVLVLQRPLKKSLVDAMKAAQRQGVAVVVELDDDMERLAARHPARRAMRREGESPAYLREACDLADWVTVSTPQLAHRYAKHGRVSVIRNTMPAWLLDEQRAPVDGKLRVGWTGLALTHPHDLDAAYGHVAQAVRELDATFVVIGSGNGVRSGLGLADEPEVIPWLDSVEDYLRALATIDIGIAPLEKSEFNRSKSWLKPLEYAASGAAFVVSPTDEYQELVSKIGGRIARKPRDWRRYVVSAAADARSEGERLREAVVRQNLTTESVAQDWIDAWERAIAVRARGGPR